VEISTGLIFLLIFNFKFLIFNEFLIFNFQTLNLLYYLLIVCLLIIIFVYDLKHYIILDKIIFPAIGIAFLYQLIFNWVTLGTYLGAAFGAAAFFLFIVLVSQGKWMGLGDVKLVFFMGLLLGFPNILTALFLAFFIGAIIGVGLIVFGKKKLKSEVPFGPFLVGGTFVAMFFSQNLINWYLDLFL